MMRLIFIHGMRQEGRNPEALRVAWRDALRGAWADAGLPSQSVEPEMPFYGDELDRLTRAVKAENTSLVQRGGDIPASATELAMLQEFASANGVTQTEVRAEMASEAVGKGPANWEWVQAIARALEKKVPGFRTLGVKLVEQVDAYLNRPHVTAAVDGIVGPVLSGAPAVVVAHSLGTIVSYRLLRSSAARWTTPLYMTLGSPLGINAVRDRIRPPKLALPEGVGRWVNGTDERDYVALYAALDATTFTAGIENITDIHNGHEDAHSITDYLRDRRIAAAIHQALAS
jgi:hypothetical protein